MSEFPMVTITDLTLYGDVNDLSPIAKLPGLRRLSIAGAGQPALSPIWKHPAIREFSLQWRRSRPD